MPAVVQNEIHPYYQAKEVVPYLQNLGIVVEAGFRLAAGDILQSCSEMK